MESEASSEKIGNDGTGYRSKATFIKRPEDPFCEKIDNLYKIRPRRLITPEDLDKLDITMKEE
jgi:hypothetical protein